MRDLLKQILGKKMTAMIAEVVISRNIRRIVRHAQRQTGGFSPESAVDLLFSKAAKDVTPWQHRGEILELARIIAAKKPRTVLEIGTASGGTLFLAACLSDDDALIVSIDLPDGLFGGGYPAWKRPLYQSFRRERQRIELIQGDSHDPEVFTELENILEGRTIDYLFIDGDHTYAGVRQDFEDYSRLLAPGGIVAFHDIAPDREAPPSHFVSVLWDELKQQYPYREFIQHPGQDKMGIGVLMFP